MSLTSSCKNDEQHFNDRFKSSVKGGFPFQQLPTGGNRENQDVVTRHGNGKLRTDFVGLFRNSGGGAQGPRLRCRNNSQAQRPTTTTTLHHAPSSWTTELQFPVEIVEEDQTWSDTISCEKTKGGNSPNPATSTAAAAVAAAATSSLKQSVASRGANTKNDTGHFPRTTTKTSFNCILSDDSAEAYHFFEAAANSGIDFPQNSGNDFASVRETTVKPPLPPPPPTSPPFKRQRHFSLEDYNDLMDEFSSDNSNSNSSFIGTKQVDGINNKIPNFMQVDDFSVLSSNGSETQTPFTPSTPNTAGLVLTNAFRFPAAGDAVSAALEQKARFFNVANAAGVNVVDDPMDSVSLDTDPEHISVQLLGELKQKLMATIGENFNVCLQFPSNLLHEIAAHVIQEASPEPCGLKGCLIFIYFEGENDCQYVNTLRCDPGTIPTFELTLTLRQGQNKKQGWISSLVKRNFALAASVQVSTSYRLVKRRKYRLNEVEELSLQ